MIRASLQQPQKIPTHVLSVFAHFEMSGSIDWPGTPIWKSSFAAPAFVGAGVLSADGEAAAV